MNVEIKCGTDHLAVKTGSIVDMPIAALADPSLCF